MAYPYQQGQQGGYPPTQSGYPPSSQAGYGGAPQGGYPPYGAGYPTQQAGPSQPYPTQGGGYPPQGGGYPPQGGYPPTQGGYPPAGGPAPGPQGYPTQQPGGYPPTQGGYPPAGAAPGPQGYPTQGPPTQPPSGFKGWYTVYYDQLSPQEVQQMRSWFAAMDRDRSGSIASNELANVAIGGLPIGLETAVKLIRIFDVDKNGTIDFYEYAALHKFLLNMQSLFQQQDTNRDGRLSSNEVVTALHAGGFKLSDQAAQALYRKYNRTGFGVNLVEFLALIAHVAQAKSVFEWRDNQKTGQISLTMDAFLEVTSEF